MGAERFIDSPILPSIGLRGLTQKVPDVSSGRRTTEVKIGTDELLRLERTYLGTLAMREHPQVLHAGKYAVYGLARALARSSSSEEAAENVRALSYGGWFDRDVPLRDFVADPAHVEELYMSTRHKLAGTSEGALLDKLAAREAGAFSIARDSQIDQTPRRPLQEYQQHGFTIQLTPEGVEEIRERHRQDTGVPLLQQVNRRKVFGNSSISPSIAAWVITHHDIMDHGLYPTLAQQEGIMDRYEGVMNRLGNPLDTDILSHKGEVVATIMYGWRESHFAYAQYPLEHTMQDMITILQQSSFPTENQRNALRILQGIDPNSPEGIQMSTLWNQELYTFDYHMRRKAGPIYELDPENNYQPIGLFDFRNPEFVAFVAESGHMLHQYEHLFKHVSLNVSLRAEQYLVDIAEGRLSADTPLVLTMGQVVGPEPDTSLPKQTQDWFRNNLWHSVDYTTRKTQSV